MLACFPATLSGIERDSTAGAIERRTLGKTGEKLSIIGFGGYVLNRSTPEQAKEWVREAFEASVNYFDVAPEYGLAEERMGPALEPYRKKVFLACKTAQRMNAAALNELDRTAPVTDGSFRSVPTAPRDHAQRRGYHLRGRWRH